LILWVSTRTSSLAARMAFALAGNPGEVREISLRAGEGRTPEFLAINPKGQVPVLQLEDGTGLTETPAIMLALGESFPASGLLGTSQRERWRVMEWLSWYAWTVPGAFMPGFAPSRFGPPAAETAIREAALGRAGASLDFAAAQLGDRDWAAGAAATAADLVLAQLTVFAGFLNLAPPDALLAHRARVFAMPALKPVLAAEGMAA
jgi:glutathione S-transferase